MKNSSRRGLATGGRRLTGAVAMAIAALSTGPSLAAEGGLTFWLPGLYGSFAAVPGVPGWSFATIYYHSSVSADAEQAFPRAGQVDLGLRGRGNLLFFGPTYTAVTPVLGGQLSFSILGGAGRNEGRVDATLTGPSGNTISGERSEALTAFGDVLPQVTLKWNKGVNNYMTYLTGDIPIGAYDPSRLANLGLGHSAVDWGAGYTYFNPETKREFSAVLGFTYNFENPDTDYQNGIDSHIDWAASQFLNDQLYVGVAGYLFNQLTGDSGDGARLGGFKTRIAGIGPQIGYNFEVSDKVAGFLNLRGYWEFAAKNRPEGWNVWLSLAFSPAAPRQSAE